MFLLYALQNREVKLFGILDGRTVEKTKQSELSAISQSMQTLCKIIPSTKKGQSRADQFFECSEGWNNNCAFSFFDFQHPNFFFFFFLSLQFSFSFCRTLNGCIIPSEQSGCILMSIIFPRKVYHILFKRNSNCTSKMASINMWYFKATSDKGCYCLFFSLF